MAMYLSQFTPRLATVSAAQCDLCKQSSEFVWGPEHETTFQAVKCEIKDADNLQFYDQLKPLVLQVDASLRGLGAALIQDKGVVAFASKSLTETEQRYSNIKRELLAIVLGLECFHHYAFGLHVIVNTDHKPLVSISKKSMASMPPCLAMMMLCIKAYDMDVQYRPGRDIPLADALSRVNPCNGRTIKGLDITVHALESQLSASPQRLQDIRRQT